MGGLLGRWNLPGLARPVNGAVPNPARPPASDGPFGLRLVSPVRFPMIFVLPYPIPAMNRLPALILGAAGLCSLLGAAPARADDSPRQTLAFDAGWQFSRGDFAGASLANFSDEGWQSVDLPHDWSILGPFDRLNPTGGAGAFLPAGVGWYRKHFRLPASDSGKRVFVEFDGVMANGDVWINGEHLGRRPYGYVSFGYELTR